MIEWAVFLVLTVALVVLPRSSLRDWRSHGFFRQFAFEANVGLLCLNARRWFEDPFSPRQLISWLLLICSLLLAIEGFRMLRTLGKPERGIETTTTVVQQGVYKYIRHPLYGSLLFLAWGAFLKAPSVWGALLALVASAAAFATAKVEERECVAKFGQAYLDYSKSTKMFIPFVF